MSHPPSYDQGNQSSLYEKLDSDLRKRLDRAIVERRPASLQDCYRAFDLATHAISRAAFYRYARRLREEAELHHVAEMVRPDEPDAGRYLPELIKRRLLDILVNEEEPSASLINRLVNAAARAGRG